MDGFHNLTIFINLVQSDFRRRYLGTYFGIFWAFAAPISTIAVLLFVFSVGFRSGPINGVNFDLWLICGLVVWFYISDAIISGANSVVEYSFVVKKIPFPTELLPIVKVTSSLYVHIGNLTLLLLLFVYKGSYPTLFWFQIVYYLFSLIVFTMGVAIVSSVIQVFFPDFQGVISILMQIGLWGTPILWDANILPEKLYPIIFLNPANYVVQGYRDSMLFHTWFFERPFETLYFWSITILLLFAGSMLFKRAKNDFADVL